MKIKLRSCLAFVLAAFLCACGGDDDDSDQTASRTVTAIADNDTQQANDLRGLTYASDGRIYASGHLGAEGEDLRTVVARFDAMGNPDQSFGGGDGFAAFNLSVAGVGASGAEESTALVELANGDLIVAVNLGEGGGSATVGEAISGYLYRVDNMGNIVTTWGDNGRVEVVFGWPNSADTLLPVASEDFPDGSFPQDAIGDLQLDSRGSRERVVVFGAGTAPLATAGIQRADQDRYVTRLLITDRGATVDPAFNGGATFTYTTPDPANSGDNSRRGFVEDDGSIMSGGYTDLGGDLGNHIILIRLLSDGTLDPGFGGFIKPEGTITGVAGPGVAAFNPFFSDGGFAECYAVVRQSDGGYVTTGYGAATGIGATSSFGYATTAEQDVVTFRVFTGANDVDQSYGNPNAPGTQAIQSESLGGPSTEERSRDMIVLADDSTVHVGYFGGTAAVYVFTPDGQLDTRVSDDGILELDHPTIEEQFYAVALSPTGDRIAMTTQDDPAGARLVVLDLNDE